MATTPKTAEHLLSKSELDALISDAEKVLAEVIEDEKDKLAKAKEEGSPESPEASAPAPEASAGGDPSAAAAPDAGSSAPAPAAPPAEAAPAAPVEGAPAAPAEGAAPEGAPADPAAEAGPVDPAALKAEYAKLDDAALEMHYMAAKEAVYERLQAQGGSPAAQPGAAPAPAASPSPAPSPSPAASPSPAPSASPDPAMAMKNEKTEGAPLAKTEDAQKIERLEKGLNSALKAIEILSTPMRKSLTGVDYTPKPAEGEKPLRKTESLTKSEITSVLSKKAADPKTTSKDRDLINGWCFGTVETKEIEHLLNEK
jgi:hypothetical protein